MRNGDDLTNVGRRLLGALSNTDDYIREWLVIVLGDANEHGLDGKKADSSGGATAAVSSDSRGRRSFTRYESHHSQLSGT
jgi:hypothetical protein